MSLKDFNVCIQSINQEISDILSGKLDDSLDYVMSYAIKEEFQSSVGIHCTFPPPIILSKHSDEISDNEENSSQTSGTEKSKKKLSDKDSIDIVKPASASTNNIKAPPSPRRSKRPRKEKEEFG
jgi:hypothetical protein